MLQERQHAKPNKVEVNDYRHRDVQQNSENLIITICNKSRRKLQIIGELADASVPELGDPMRNVTLTIPKAAYMGATCRDLQQNARRVITNISDASEP